MKKFVAYIDKCENEFFTEVLGNCDFNFRAKTIGTRIKLEVVASSINSIPYAIRDMFCNESI